MSHTNSSKNIEKSCIYFSKTFSVSPRSGTQKENGFITLFLWGGTFLFISSTVSPFSLPDQGKRGDGARYRRTGIRLEGLEVSAWILEGNGKDVGTSMDFIYVYTWDYCVRFRWVFVTLVGEFVNNQAISRMMSEYFTYATLVKVKCMWNVYINVYMYIEIFKM